MTLMPDPNRPSNNSQIVRIDADVLEVMRDAAVAWGMQFKSPSKVLRVLIGIDPPPREVGYKGG